MWKTTEGSTGRLLQYCLGYFFFYVIYGVTLKYFQAPPAQGFPGMSGLQFLVYSTIGGSVVALFVCLGLRWYRMRSNRIVQWGPLRVPTELRYIMPSGVLTAIIIPTTTLMYSLPISVMVAMVIMRGAIIVVSRLVDAVQIRQGLMRKRVYAEENWAVVFALLAVGTTVFVAPGFLDSIGVRLGAPAASATATGGKFEFLHSPVAMTILVTYIIAYGIRIYIMNYFKNTRQSGVPLDNKGFFALEQMAAFATLVLCSSVMLAVPTATPDAAGTMSQRAVFQAAFRSPHPAWTGAVLAGTSFGITAFFSVFIFMFQGRTATFAGLVNRLTSLVAGTTSTLIFYFAFRGRFPTAEDWLSLVFILVAVGFLTVAERRRAAELSRTERRAAPSIAGPDLAPKPST